MMKTYSAETPFKLTLVREDGSREAPIEFSKFSAARNYCRSRIGKAGTFSHGELKQPDGTTLILKP